MAKVAFLQRGIYENLGVMQLSSVLKQGGHAVLVLIESLEKDAAQALAAFGPDLVCFSVLTGSHRAVHETIDRLRPSLPDALFVIGGPHPTYFPETVESAAVDVACVGEGEGAVLDLANAVPDRERIRSIPNLIVRGEDGRFSRNAVRPLVPDLDRLPFPDREGYYRYPVLRQARRKTFLTTRGCPYNCSFCFNHQYRRLYRGKGKYVRARSADNIIREILEVKEKYGLGSVFIQDDTFILDKVRLRDFLEQYAEQVGLPFTCLVRADLTDEETAQLLKGAGCVGVQFGIESGDEGIRNQVLRKNLTDEQIVAAAALFKKQRIPFKTYNMLGLPGEDLAGAFRTVALNARIRADLPWASILVPYPRTDIAEEMKRTGRISADYDVDDISSTFFDTKPGDREERAILNLQRLFFWAVRFPVLTPLIKRLVRLPPNPIFDLLFYLGQLHVYRVSENVDWGAALRMGWNFVRLNMRRGGRA